MKAYERAMTGFHTLFGVSRWGCVNVNMYIYIYIYMYVYMCIYIYMYI